MITPTSETRPEVSIRSNYPQLHRMETVHVDYSPIAKWGCQRKLRGEHCGSSPTRHSHLRSLSIPDWTLPNPPHHASPLICSHFTPHHHYFRPGFHYSQRMDCEYHILRATVWDVYWDVCPKDTRSPVPRERRVKAAQDVLDSLSSFRDPVSGRIRSEWSM